MAKTSGGTRKSVKPKTKSIKPFKESEKAIQVEAEFVLEFEHDPFGGATPRDAVYKKKVWVPKSQIENGNISEWVQKSKIDEESIGKTNFVVGGKVKFFDATGREIPVTKTQREREWAKEREQKRLNALAGATKEREDLIAKAKANNYKAHSRMKTRTLRQMAEGTYGQPKSTPSSSRRRNFDEIIKTIK